MLVLLLLLLEEDGFDEREGGVFVLGVEVEGADWDWDWGWDWRDGVVEGVEAALERLGAIVAVVIGRVEVR